MEAPRCVDLSATKQRNSGAVRYSSYPDRPFTAMQWQTDCRRGQLPVLSLREIGPGKRTTGTRSATHRLHCRESFAFKKRYREFHARRARLGVNDPAPQFSVLFGRDKDLSSRKGAAKGATSPAGMKMSVSRYCLYFRSVGLGLDFLEPNFRSSRTIGRRLLRGENVLRAVETASEDEHLVRT